MLNKIKFSYKEADKQNNLFTSYHTLFKCKIKYAGLSYTFNYQCNTAHMMPNLKDCLECVLLDADCYEYSDNVLDFAMEYGYDDTAKCLKAFKACKRTYNALHRLFTESELEELRKEIEEAE